MLSKLPVARTVTYWGGPRNYPLGGPQGAIPSGNSGSWTNFWRSDYDLDQNGDLVDFRQEFFPAICFYPFFSPMGNWFFAVPLPEIEMNMPADIRALAEFARNNPLF